MTLSTGFPSLTASFRCSGAIPQIDPVWHAKLTSAPPERVVNDRQSTLWHKTLRPKLIGHAGYPTIDGTPVFVRQSDQNFNRERK